MRIRVRPSHLTIPAPLHSQCVLPPGSSPEPQTLSQHLLTGLMSRKAVEKEKKKEQEYNVHCNDQYPQLVN